MQPARARRPCYDTHIPSSSVFICGYLWRIFSSIEFSQLLDPRAVADDFDAIAVALAAPCREAVENPSGSIRPSADHAAVDRLQRRDIFMRAKMLPVGAARKLFD